MMVEEGERKGGQMEFMSSTFRGMRLDAAIICHRGKSAPMFVVVCAGSLDMIC